MVDLILGVGVVDDGRWGRSAARLVGGSLSFAWRLGELVGDGLVLAGRGAGKEGTGGSDGGGDIVVGGGDAGRKNSSG